jgi:hypothetical protein
MKFKPCCENRCLVSGCIHRESGACYCICRMHDKINALKSIQEGMTLFDGMGMQYIPDEALRQETFDKWSDEKKKFYQDFRKTCPALIKVWEDKIKEYEIK